MLGLRQIRYLATAAFGLFFKQKRLNNTSTKQ